MHLELIKFLTEHSELICIPIGIGFRYLKVLSNKNHKSGKTQELLIDKTYEHMRELSERGDKAVRDHSQLLNRHNSLKKRHKSLKTEMFELSEQLKLKENYIKELEERYLDKNKSLEADVSLTRNQDVGK